jgi:hypothetical protein
MALFGSLLGGNQGGGGMAPAAPAQPDGSQSMNPLTRMKTKEQQVAKGQPVTGKKVSDVDLGDMGQPVPTAPMQG